MIDIPNGKYTARITAILDAVYRNRGRNRLDEALFIQFQVWSMGTVTTLSDVVTFSPHHKGKLGRMFKPVMKQLGLPLASFITLKDKLLSARLELAVTDGKDGKQFVFTGIKDDLGVNPNG